MRGGGDRSYLEEQQLENLLLTNWMEWATLPVVPIVEKCTLAVTSGSSRLIRLV